MRKSNKYEIVVRGEEGKVKGYVYPQGSHWVAELADSIYSESFLDVGKAVEEVYRYGENRNEMVVASKI